MTERKRRVLWALSVTIALVIGFLLGLRFCRVTGSATSDAGQVVGGGAGSGGSAKERIGPGSSQGKMKVNGGGNGHTGADTDTVGGTATASGGGNVDVGGGNGEGGGEVPGGKGGKKLPKQVDTLSQAFVAHMSENFVTGEGKSPSAPPDPRVTTKTADDFSLDATGLPRFPMDVTTAFTSISTRSDKPADTGTAAAFSTSDSYDSVTSWYRSHMPRGARETNADVNQMRELAAQLTPKNIMKSLGIQPNQPSPADTTPVQPADTTAAGSRVDGWQLPDDGVHGERTVMVVSSPGKPTTVLMGRSKRP